MGHYRGKFLVVEVIAFEFESNGAKGFEERGAQLGNS